MEAFPVPPTTHFFLLAPSETWIVFGFENILRYQWMEWEESSVSVLILLFPKHFASSVALTVISDDGYAVAMTLVAMRAVCPAIHPVGWGETG